MDIPSNATVIPGHQEPVRLYSVSQIGVATFIGAPLAGCWLMARNFARLNMPDKARRTRLYGLLSTVALIVVAYLLAAFVPHFPSSVIPAAYTGTMIALARQHQGAQLTAHHAAKGLRPSYAGVFGISLVSLVICTAALLGAAFVVPEDKVVVAEGHEVYFQEGATADEARNLGSYLTQTGYFRPGHEAAAFVEQNRGVYTISFVVNDGAWNNAEIVAQFEVLRTDMQKQKLFGNQPIAIHLVNDLMLVKKALP
jgi:hypothetical protein